MRTLSFALAAWAAFVGCASPPPVAAPPVDLVVPPMPSARPAEPAAERPAAEPPSPVASPSEAASAEALFQEGRDAFLRGDYATARDRFTESLRLDPAVGTALNLATVEERMGDVAGARLHYQEAYDRAIAAGQTDRAAFAKNKLRTLPPP